MSKSINILLHVQIGMQYFSYLKFVNMSVFDNSKMEFEFIHVICMNESAMEKDTVNV